MKVDPSGEWCSCSATRTGNGANVAALLTPDERSALQELVSGPIGRRIPTPEAERLLTLGLAELCCGSLVLTVAGRHVLSAVRGG